MTLSPQFHWIIMENQIVHTRNLDSATIPYLRRHSMDITSCAIWKEHSRVMQPSRFSRDASMAKQCAFFSVVFFCGFIFFLGRVKTPFSVLFQYEERLASIIRIDAALMKLEAELPMRERAFVASGCDYAKGRWMKDEVGPLYSGKECTRWLTDVWACRLSNRTNFEYENYRWQPDDCDLPRFNGEVFLSRWERNWFLLNSCESALLYLTAIEPVCYRMKNKIVAFVGDSIGRQQFQSLMCLITGGKKDTDVEDASADFGLMQAPGAIRPAGWAYRFSRSNTTIMFYWSATLSYLELLNQTDPSAKIAVHIDLPSVFLRENFQKFHVLIVNTGSHWNTGKFKKNRWEMYLNNTRLSATHDLNDVKKAYNFTVHSVIRWVDQQLETTSVHAFLRTLSPKHFAYGDWNTGGKCDNTRLRPERHHERKGPWKDKVAEHAVQNTRVNLLNITLMSQFRDEAHVSKYSWKSKNGSQDCLHWCLPGVPDTWNEVMYAQLFEGRREVQL